ncbi:MAG: threonine/serine exporter family protein [Lachnospiraceae bacterium]|nr:threonine/serine exporter family protein [Lachnospiraceae bacterium]
MAGNIELVVLSFLASLGFAIVFQVAKKDLLLAGLGGGLTRIFYLVFIAIIPSRIVYVALAAMVAALYAEIVSGMKHVPATYFMYPTIIPLIPGDLFYYTCAGIITGNAEMFRTNAINLILALVGLTVGFVVCSFVSNIMRIRRLATIAGKSDEEY